MTRTDDRRDGALTLALTAVAGFALGTVAGMVLGGSMGRLHGERVRHAFGRLRRSSRAPNPEETERAVRAALSADETTRDLDLQVHAPGDGLVELTGVVTDALVRRAAADVARSAPGVEVVVNRILVQGTDLPPPPASTGGRGP
ncbi:MAG: BON domain-containing protein [Gemmatimonadota bacterium]|nr:BON domain-containing protein [Gemmatimonadota bacterium]